MEKYYLLQIAGGDIYFHELTQEHIAAAFNGEDADYNGEDVVIDLPFDETGWFNLMESIDDGKIIIIKGELVQPEPVTVVEHWHFK